MQFASPEASQPGQGQDSAMTLARLHAVALAHPRLALPLYQHIEAACLAPEGADPATVLEAVCGQFFVLERLGRGGELWQRLHSALEQSRQLHAPQLAARLHEALGRIHYLRAEYGEATQQWSTAVDLAAVAGDARTGVNARIGLGQIHYALGDWASGHRFHADAQGLMAGLDDAYLAGKLALNLGVGLFNQQAFAEADGQFSQGLAAARRARHRDYQAEALWYLARCAQARGDVDGALLRCQQALNLALRIGYAWLQASASATLCELAFSRDDAVEALRAGEQSLAIAKRIGARRLQSAAHRALARLYQSQGKLGAALEQLWLHQGVEAELARHQLPEQVGQLAQYDLSHKGPEEQLLELSNQHWPVDNAEDFQRAVEAMAEAVRAALGLDGLRFWWDEEAKHDFRELRWDGQPAGNLAGAPRYLALMATQTGALALADLSLHPCHQELAALQGAAQSRIELALTVQGRCTALLWLEQHQLRAWTRQDALRASHIAKLYERLLLALDLSLAKQARAQMEQEKITALGRLVAGIAHDVNTPIGVAITAASGMDEAAKQLNRALWAEKVSRNELQRLCTQIGASAELIDRNLQRAAALIGDFKRVAVDQSSGQVLEIALGDYLRSVVTIHGPALRKARAQVELKLEDGLQMTVAAGLLTQVVSNLIMNSLTHGFVRGDGGQITISARREGEMVQLEFADDGVGVSEAVRAHVFEPFFTTKRGQGGSGLGMFIVQDIVNRLHGSISLPPTSKGFCVSMRLPLKPPAEPKA